MRFFKLTLLAAGFLSLASCSKYPPLSSRLLEDLAILTQYDVNTNFGQYKTFSMVDSISYISDKSTKKILDAQAKAVLTRIAQDLTSRGYQEVAKSTNPDLGINVSAIEVTNVTAYYPGWYWGYPGYYPPDWWGYPGNSYYYPYYPTYYTSYSSGTLSIEMVNFKKINPKGQIPVVWNAFIRGLLTGTHTTVDITNSIDQSFAQTPVLKTSL
ncbi:MAG: DUF4136 domain-containing protein [Bacteroidales bacterium]